MGLGGDFWALRPPNPEPYTLRFESLGSAGVFCCPGQALSLNDVAYTPLHASLVVPTCAGNCWCALNSLLFPYAFSNFLLWQEYDKSDELREV